MSNKPTHGEPLTQAEKDFPRGSEAGVKAWQGGPRQVRNRRAGLYKTRTGNTDGGKKKRSPMFKKGPKPSGDRPVSTPGWVAKYVTE